MTRLKASQTIAKFEKVYGDWCVIQKDITLQQFTKAEYEAARTRYMDARFDLMLGLTASTRQPRSDFRTEKS